MSQISLTPPLEDPDCAKCAMPKSWHSSAPFFMCPTDMVNKEEIQQIIYDPFDSFELPKEPGQ